MLATIIDNTRHVLNMQHISQIRKDEVIQTSPVATLRLQGEGGYHPRK